MKYFAPKMSKPRHATRSTAVARLGTSWRAGFTLVEITVVLAIAAVVTAITVSGMSSMAAGNKRVACQSNLVQIYQALRQYASDEAGSFPVYTRNNSFTAPNPPAPNPATDIGIGLWALYTYPQDGSSTAIALVGTKPTERYLRSLKVLHCPNDYDFPRDETGTQLPNTIRDDNVYQDAAKTTYNPNYCSYQVWDNVWDRKPTSPPPARTWTYLPSRLAGGTRRQLLQSSGRPPADNTVVTWCQWHRTGVGGRDYDNVLFYDGTVQYLPRNKATASDAACSPLSPNCVNGWERTPKAPS